MEGQSQIRIAALTESEEFKKALAVLSDEQNVKMMNAVRNKKLDDAYAHAKCIELLNSLPVDVRRVAGRL